MPGKRLTLVRDRWGVHPHLVPARPQPARDSAASQGSTVAKAVRNAQARATGDPEGGATAHRTRKATSGSTFASVLANLRRQGRA